MRITRDFYTKASIFILLLMVIGLLTTLYLMKTRLDEQYATLKQEYGEYQSSTTETLAIKEATINELAGQLQLTQEELDETEDNLRSEKNRNDAFEEQVNELASSVGDLDKLVNTDEELLMKYSKVYFLNEHYTPKKLREIDDEWKYDESKELKLLGDVMPFFEDMVEDAKDDGIDLWVVSAYRSFEYQTQLKSSYSITYGTGANAFSADQGYSEHQLGTTIDFTTSGIGGGLSGFGNTEAYQWLLDNAYKYGFVLSYPEDNSYYVFEPWHWRFVGEELAKDLKDDDAHFYDWDQRKLNSYLLHLFD